MIRRIGRERRIREESESVGTNGTRCKEEQKERKKNERPRGRRRTGSGRAAEEKGRKRKEKEEKGGKEGGYLRRVTGTLGKSATIDEAVKLRSEGNIVSLW